MLQFWYQNKVPPFSYQASSESNRVRSRAAPGCRWSAQFFDCLHTVIPQKSTNVFLHLSFCLWKSTWAPEIWPCVRLAWLLSAERKQGPWCVEDGCCGNWDFSHSKKSKYTYDSLWGGKKKSQTEEFWCHSEQAVILAARPKSTWRKLRGFKHCCHGRLCSGTWFHPCCAVACPACVMWRCLKLSCHVCQML